MTMAKTTKKTANEKTKNEIVIDLLAPGKKVAPENINAAVGGPYAARYISALRKLGYDIQSVKEGRSVVAYMMAVPAVAEVVDEEDSFEDESEDTIATVDAEEDDADEEIAPLAAASYESSFAVSEDWDEYEGDVRSLVR